MAPTYQVRLSLPENDLVQQIRKSERDNPSLPDQNIYRLYVISLFEFSAEYYN